MAQFIEKKFKLAAENMYNNRMIYKNTNAALVIKKSYTRISRIKKYQTRILKGQVINDCVFSLFIKKPSCNGAHKQLKIQEINPVLNKIDCI